jgi:two-component system chemotaxis response regulator CheY
MKSLVVEDDAIGRALLTDILERHGTIVACDNGGEAVNAFSLAVDSDEPFDLVCLDIMMPEMDGHEVLRRIRDLEKSAGVSAEDGVKVIMITALDDSESVLRSYTGRCAAYCVKPIDVEVFYNHLSELGLLSD